MLPRLIGQVTFVTMVRVIQNGGKIFYECTECGLRYEQKEIAEKCKAWCSVNHSCNLEIIKYAVKKEE